MKRDKITTLSLLFLGILSGGVVFLIVVNKIFPVIMPFLIAWTVAFAVRGPAKRLSLKIRVPEKILRLFLAVFLSLLVLAGVSFAIWQMSAMLWRFLSEIDESSALFRFFEALSSPTLPIFGDILPPELSDRLAEAADRFITGILAGVAESVTSWITLVPGALFFLLVTLISLVYFTLDLERINAFVKGILPRKITDFLVIFRNQAFSVIGKYLFSYLIILCITFLIMFVGFFLLGVKYAPLVAIIVAFLDILPVIGVGTVLVPWSIFSFVTGNVGRGIGLLILFVANTVIRQFSEPKIVGKSLDLHPLITLAALYVGYSLFGIAGLVAAPILSVAFALIKNDSAAQVDKTSLGE